MMRSSLFLFLAALGTFAGYASASAQAEPAPTPSTLTLPITLSPSTPGGQTSVGTLVITLNPTPNGGPAFTSPSAGESPEPAVPDDIPICASLDALVSSCTTLSSFWGLPLSAQAQCLCNVGPWDSVVSSCFDQLTVDGQYYASSITSHGLLGLCSSLGIGPTSVIASVSATSTPAAATETSSVTPKSVTGSAAGSTTGSAAGSGSAAGNTTLNATRSAPQSPTESPASGSSSLAWPSLLVWLLPWLLVGAVASL